MKTSDYSKVDSETRSQMYFVDCKNAIEALEKELAKEVLASAELSRRLKVLEDARARQIELNGDSLVRLSKLEGGAGANLTSNVNGIASIVKSILGIFKR